MAIQIHPSSQVDPKAQIDDGVTIGPYCLVGPNVTMHKNVNLVGQCSISGLTEIGADTQIYPFVALGYPPQDLKHKGGDVKVIIGERNILREQVTIHPGTDGGRRQTVIGDDCYFMVGSHVAHDCIVGNHVVLSNGVQVGGFVTIGDYVILGGMSAVHQFTRIGSHAFVGGVAAVINDVIPYGSVVGNPAHLAGLNLTGLKRRDFPRSTIRDLRSAYRLLFAEEGTFAERLKDTARLYEQVPEVMSIVDFINNQEKRNIAMPKFER